MTDVLLIFHFVGLMLGAGGGLGSTVVMGYANAQGGKRGGPLRAVGPALARMSLAGLFFLWATGLPLLFIKYNVAAMPVMFWMKMVFVASLTFAAVTIEMTYGRVKAGDARAANLLPSLGPLAGLSSLMAVIFAVLAFH